ncbi:hypothetical protein EB796_023076 [Bugula neritina]|uniref:Uncharacterized protein n=1 Tax=Bugula neritina TaxID=10212 RepID=A0A7J7IYF3_BUGNE|nr:hypothetical protein EB796_023076 [Bugula neritina]
MEMSKKRYKYMTQADFNKKYFITKQQKKKKLMPQLLHNINVDEWLSKKTLRHVPKYTNSSASNARFAFLDRLEKQGQKCKDFQDEEENPFAYPSKPTPPEKQNLPEFYRIRLKEQEEAELAKTTFPTQPIMRPVTQRAVAFCSQAETESHVIEAAQSVKSVPVCKPAQLTALEKRTHLLKRAQSSGKFRSVEDPRYVELENSLCIHYFKPEELDTKKVQAIIQAQDSLHVPSNAVRNSRPKLQKTILEYLRARGIPV